MIGEWLYALTPRDQQDALIAPVRVSGSSSSSATIVIAELYPVPIDKLFIPCGWVINCTPGASVDVVRAQLTAVPVDGAVVSIFISGTDFRNAINVERTHFGHTPHLIIPGGQRIRAVGVFSSGAAANTVSANLYGLLIPRGNISLP